MRAPSRRSRPRHRRLFALSIAAAACVALVASSISAGENNAKPSFKLTIGGLVPDTGPFTFAGAYTHKNAEFAVSLVNQALKANGWKASVKLVTADTQTTPVGAASAARKVLAQGAHCIVGALTSAETITAAQSVLIPEKIPTVSPSATAAAITTLKDKGLVYRIAPSDTFASSGLANYASRAFGGASGKTISIAGRNDAYGTGSLDAFAKAWKKLGGKIQGPVIYDSSAASFDSEAQQIVSGSPDGYAIFDFPDGYTKLAPALLRTGKFDLNKTFIGDALATISPKEDNVPAAFLNGATGVKAQSPEAAKAYKAYTAAYARFPGTSNVGGFGPQVFDATMMCAVAAISAHSSDAAKIAKSLTQASNPPGPKLTWQNLKGLVGRLGLGVGKEIDYEGVSGPINWDKNGDVSAATYAVLQFRNGESVRIGTFAVKSGP